MWGSRLFARVYSATFFYFDVKRGPTSFGGGGGAGQRPEGEEGSVGRRGELDLQDLEEGERGVPVGKGPWPVLGRIDVQERVKEVGLLEELEGFDAENGSLCNDWTELPHTRCHDGTC